MSIEEIPTIVQTIKNEDGKPQFKGIQKARVHLSNEDNPPIDEYIKAGILPPILKCLKKEE